MLISNTARLLWYGGHSAGVLDQYWKATVRAVRHGVHAPANLEGEPLWFFFTPSFWRGILGLGQATPDDADVGGEAPPAHSRQVISPAT